MNNLLCPKCNKKKFIELFQKTKQSSFLITKCFPVSRVLFQKYKKIS